MARLARYAPAEIPQHIIQRGNNRQVCFARSKDLTVYAMHLLCRPPTDHATSQMMQFLGRRYVRHFNVEYGCTGILFEGRFKSCPVQSEHYVINCLTYIELNPVRAGVVKDPAKR